MNKLAADSDAILMDLRSFSQQNQGCLYELEQLINRVDLARIVFLVDQTTDLPFLEHWVQTLWKKADQDSPNLKAVSPTLHLFHVDKQSRRAMKSLLVLLLSKTETASA